MKKRMQTTSLLLLLLLLAAALASALASHSRQLASHAAQQHSSKAARHLRSKAALRLVPTMSPSAQFLQSLVLVAAETPREFLFRTLLLLLVLLVALVAILLVTTPSTRPAEWIFHLIPIWLRLPIRFKSPSSPKPSLTCQIHCAGILEMSTSLSFLNGHTFLTQVSEAAPTQRETVKGAFNKGEFIPSPIQRREIFHTGEESRMLTH